MYYIPLTNSKRNLYDADKREIYNGAQYDDIQM